MCEDVRNCEELLVLHYTMYGSFNDVLSSSDCVAFRDDLKTYQFVVWQLPVTEDATKLTSVVTPPKYLWKLTIFLSEIGTLSCSEMFVIIYQGCLR